MHTRFYVLALLGCCLLANSIAYAQGDEIAVDYAEDAVATLQSEYDRLQAEVSSGKVSADDLERRLHELIDARLLLLRLKKDHAGMTKLLQEDMHRHEKRAQKLTELVDRRVASADQLAIAELQVLAARLSFAEHTGDEALKMRTLKEAIEIEKQRLKKITDMASRGLVSRKTIAVQKLRIAQIILDKKIAPPQRS